MALPMPANNDIEFTPPPAGTHRSVCYRVIDLGTQQIEWNNQVKHQHKILISWELSDELMTDGEKAGLPFTIHQRYTHSSSDKATLRKHLESWRGKAFEESDFGPGGFELSSLQGVPCLLSVVHAYKNNKTYANITGISRLVKGMDKPQQVNPSVYLELTRDGFKQDVFNDLSEGLRGVISRSPEYAELMGTAQPDEPEPAAVAGRNPTTPADSDPPLGGGDINDDIPFAPF